MKYQSFDWSDLSTFPTWVTTFLNGINIFKPTEQKACEMTLYLMQDKAAEMTKHLSGQVDMTNLKNLLKEMDQIFNASGNQEVLASLFESLTQKEDESLQDYAYQLEHLFKRAYPSEKVDTSLFLKQKFISGLLSKPLKICLRSPPLPTTFRSAVTVALAHMAALYPDQQIVRSRSAIYKAAVYHPNPIVSLKWKENNIQSLVEEPDTDIMEMLTKERDSSIRIPIQSTNPAIILIRSVSYSTRTCRLGTPKRTALSVKYNLVRQRKRLNPLHGTQGPRGVSFGQS